MIAKCCNCGGEGVPTTGQEIYPHRPDLHSLKFFKCPKCPDVYVGCHKKGAKNEKGVGNAGEPLGMMADRELRSLKKTAHSLFDPFWKDKKIKRYECYRRLAEDMGIKQSECHIGMFTKSQCRQAILVLKGW